MFGVIPASIADVLLGEKEEIESAFLAELGKAAATIAVDEMFKGAYFDILKMRDVAKAVGKSQIPWEIEDVLHPLHCVPWRSMDKDTRAKVQALCRWVIEH